MSQIYRVKEGKILFGVCSGLEASGRGDAWLWRIAMLTLAWPLYPFLLAKKSVDTVNEAKELLKDNSRLGGNVDKIEVELEKITAMKEKGLLSEEEYDQMRKKIMGL